MSRKHLGVAAVLVVPALAAVLRAQDDTSRAADSPVKADRLGLTVDGHATAPADRVSVELVVEGQAEVGADAEPIHRSKLRSVLEALDELKAKLEAEKKPLDGGDGAEAPPFTVEVAERGSMINVSGYMAGSSRSRATTTVTVASGVTVRLKGASECSHVKLRKRLIRIIDAAIDAGAELGAPDARLRPTLRFEPRDPEGLREAAYKDALEKAHDRATRLAHLAGRELGPISGLTELAWSVRGSRSDYRSYGNNQQYSTWRETAHQQRRADSQGVAALMSPIEELTTTMTEIEMDTTVAVEYELGKVISK